MQDIRCEKCNKLLYRYRESDISIYTKESDADGVKGVISVKCPRCETLDERNYINLKRFIN